LNFSGGANHVFCGKPQLIILKLTFLLEDLQRLPKRKLVLDGKGPVVELPTATNKCEGVTSTLPMLGFGKEAVA